MVELGSSDDVYKKPLDLYGKDCIVFFRKFQRPEHKFASFEALKAQIARDIEAGHAFFEK